MNQKQIGIGILIGIAVLVIVLLWNNNQAEKRERFRNCMEQAHYAEASEAYCRDKSQE
jgi:sensor domain CHASE-containing protein